MNKIKEILYNYWMVYLVNAVITCFILGYNRLPIKVVLGDIAINWILLTIILFFIDRDNHGRFAI